MPNAPIELTEDHRDPGLESTLDETFTRLVEEGDERMSRTWPQLLSTGTVAGLEVTFGVLVLLAVEEATGNHLLAGLAFSVGFLALLMGRSELFTESFFVPVITVVAGHRSLRDLGRLWSSTLLMNLVGGWVLTWLAMVAYPRLHAVAVETGAHYVNAGWTAEAFALSVLAGAAITLMTRMQHGTEEMVGKIVAAVAGAFVIAGLQMHHSVLDSLLAFAALHTGEAPFGHADWLGFFVFTAVGNLVGGVGLVTLLRLVRSLPRLRQERRAAGLEPS
jgi:formate/nitrite transporter FocA (FNT family)